MNDLEVGIEIAKELGIPEPVDGEVHLRLLRDILEEVRGLKKRVAHLQEVLEVYE